MYSDTYRSIIYLTYQLPVQYNKQWIVVFSQTMPHVSNETLLLPDFVPNMPFQIISLNKITHDFNHFIIQRFIGKRCIYFDIISSCPYLEPVLERLEELESDEVRCFDKPDWDARLPT